MHALSFYKVHLWQLFFEVNISHAFIMVSYRQAFIPSPPPFSFNLSDMISRNHYNISPVMVLPIG